MSFPTFVSFNGISSFILYNLNEKQIYHPLPSFKSFGDIATLLSNNKITNFSVNENFKDSFGNVVAVFLDRTGNQWHSVVQYDKINNQLNPPISFQPYIINSPPAVVCLKGQKRQYGPSLENAPSNMIYIGRNLNMGGWKLPKSKWHNPFTVKEFGKDEALRRYREYILNTTELLNSLHELGGKILACWCHPESCHGNILIDLYRGYTK